MKITIIHRPERTDREEYILQLIRAFKDVSILDAVIPKRGESSAGKSIAGCTASHIRAVSKYLINEPLLVLEDDAVIDSQAYAKIVSLKSIPEDCGAITLGGDGLPRPVDIWTPVTGKFFGTQAIIYLPRIKKTKFTEMAWEILALSPVEGEGALCYESIMMQSLHINGLKLYRPPLLAATAAKTVSDRTGEVEERINSTVVLGNNDKT